VTEEIRTEGGAAEERLVPTWLAVLVLVLLVAVVAVGGFIARGMLSSAGLTTEQREVRRWEGEALARPSDPRVRLNLGYAYQRDKQFDRALEQYRQVLQGDPTSTGALYNMGVIYIELGLGKQAEARFWDVLEVDPQHALAAKALGDYYAKQGHYKSLISAVRPVVQANPRLADLQSLMGLAYEKLGKPDWARARYRLALQYAPDLKEARAGLRRLEGLTGDGSLEPTIPGETE
jgi:tetratricopeptide (TPR) repeat protein